MKMVLLNKISDEKNLVRFVNEDVMRKSIGMREGKCWKCSFPLQLISYYQRCEGVASDPYEGGTIINLGEQSGKVTTGNDALVSCWSVCDDLSDPWISLADSLFADRIKRPYALVSSVGKVKAQINKILNEINSEYRDDYGPLILNAIYGRVDYYPAKGLLLEEWKKKINPEVGIDLPTIQNIFHKPVQNKFGQRHDADCECRFALIANPRDFKDANNDIISGKKILDRFVYYSLFINSQSHYIEKVLRCSHPSGCKEVMLDEICSSAEIA